MYTFKEQALMWTGCTESETGPSQVSGSISAGESGRSRSDRGTYTYIQRSGRGDQTCLINRLLCLLARSCMTLSSLWTWRWVCVCVCVQTQLTLFSFPFHLWFLLQTLDSRAPVSDTGGNVSNYRGPVCEGHARMPVAVWGVSVESQHHRKTHNQERPVAHTSDVIWL